MDFKGRIDVTKFADQTPLPVGGVCKKFRVTIDGKEYVFKQNYETKTNGKLKAYFDDQFMPEHVEELRGDIVEVFSSYLLRQLGCDFALPYYLASINGKNGCLSPNFKKNGEQEIVFQKILMNLFTKTPTPQAEFSSEQISAFFKEFDMQGGNRDYCLSVDYIIDKTKNFAEKYGFEFDTKTVTRQLQKTVIFDYFTGNGDRQLFNIVFMEKEKDGKKILELSPLFDNGEGFSMEDMDKIPSKRFLYKKKTDGDKQELITKKPYVYTGISDSGLNNTFAGNKYFGKQKIIAVDIHNLAKKDPEIANMLNKILNLDFNKLLQDFENDNSFKLNKNHKQVLKAIFNSRRREYNKAIQNYEKMEIKAKQKKQQEKTM